MNPSTPPSEDLRSRLVQRLTRDGKKTRAQRILRAAMEEVCWQTADLEPVEVLNAAVATVEQCMELRTRRLGGIAYQVPVAPERHVALAVRSLVDAARRPTGRPMASKLADEVMAAWRGDWDSLG